MSDTWTLEAKVQGLADSRVRWDIQEGNTGGTITNEGSYTAPGTVGAYHIIVSSVAEPELRKTIAVTVLAHGFFVVGKTPANDGNTATLLANGKVLLVGGTCDSGLETPSCANGFVLNSTLFDPATSRFIQGAAINSPRTNHTATLLNDGTVLIVGGMKDIPMPTAEVFDSITGTFSLTNPMANARIHHTATLLANGKVLVVGGCTDPFCAKTVGVAELYDTSTRVFSPTGALSTARASHTATLVLDGKVWIAGGYTPDHTFSPAGISGTAEYYDPAIASFTPSIEVFSYNQSATLLPDGTVLLAGGRVAGGAGVIDSILLFDPVTDTFLGNSQRMTVRRELHTATLLPSSAILFSGGAGSTAPWYMGRPVIGPIETLDLAEIYDPHRGSTAPVAPLHFKRSGHTATLLPDGRVLITGGGADTAELFK